MIIRLFADVFYLVHDMQRIQEHIACGSQWHRLSR